MHTRRQIRLGTSDPVTRKRGRGGWTLLVIVAALAFGGGLGLGYWWKVEAPSASLPAPTAEMVAAPTARRLTSDGVFRRSTTVNHLLTHLAVDPQIRSQLLNRPAWLEYGAIAAGSRYRIAYGSGKNRPIRTITYEYDDSTLHELRFLPYPDFQILERNISEHQVAYAGVITKNFWLSILDHDDIHHALIPKVEEALQWTVDLFHLSPGDRYKLIYTEQRRDGQVVGIRSLDAVRIETAAKVHTVFGHWVKDTLVYLDHYGSGLKRGFLKAPVKFAIISSPYSKSREHPVTGITKPHGGTDFAAPQGAPIMALGNGTVKRKTWGKFNGNYVEIQHDGTYTTLYLHMDDFAPGLSIGQQVRQGEVIGYVGRTGQATGPHVCLRFRENGKEVNFEAHRNEKIAGTPAVSLSGFFARRDSLREKLESLEFDGILF